MDGLKLLKDDHDRVKKLFQKFQQAGERAYRTKRKLVDEIIKELSVHAAVEEEVLYPAARESAGGAEGLVLESLEEHHVVKWTLSELEGMDARAERFDAKVKVLMENVLDHAREEERELFPKIRKAMTPGELRQLGGRLEQARKTAPTRPHPRAEADTQQRPF